MLYISKDGYIDLLFSYDEKVMHNKNETRPYLYLEINLNGNEYVVPLSSADEGKKFFNKNTQIKLSDRKGKELGRLFFINMIPFNEAGFKVVDVENLQEPYRSLVRDEIISMNIKKEKIMKMAKFIYQNRYNEKSRIYNTLKNNACDFKKLEEVAVEYSKNIVQDIILEDELDLER